MQSSIAFVSVGKGNVAAAIVSATASNIIGVFLTPLMAGLLLQSKGGISMGEVGKIFGQLLAPFIAGHLLRPWLGAWAQKNKAILTLSDRGSIVLAVYTAFSAAVIEGLWHKIGITDLAAVIGVDAILLVLVLAITTFAARRLGFNREDEVAIVFCGSKKSLATGVPMANVLFPPATVGMAILPLMIFHQMQMIAAAALARNYAKQAEAGEALGCPKPISESDERTPQVNPADAGVEERPDAICRQDYSRYSDRADGPPRGRCP